MTKTVIFAGAVLFVALLACGSSDRTVKVESPDEQKTVLVPASQPPPPVVVQPAPAPSKTKIKKKTITPNGTVIEQETEIKRK